MKFVERKYRSLKGHNKMIFQHYGELQSKYKRKQTKILYPETSILDDFMKERGLSKKLKHNVTLKGGKPVFSTR